MTDPGQPERPAPAEPTGWRRWRARRPAILAVILGAPVVAIGIVVVLVLTSEPGSGATASTTPTAAAEAFLTALHDDDRDTAADLLCKPSGLPHGLDEYLSGDPDLSLVEPIKEGQLVTNGKVTGTWRGERVEASIHLRLEGGDEQEWCISVFAVAPPL